jgi:uncharacterized protein
MQINVSQQLKTNIGTEKNYIIDESIDIFGLLFKSPVYGSAKLTRTNRGILVDTNISTKVPVECSRCLTPFDIKLDIHFEEEYFPSIDVISGMPNEISEENSDYMIDEHHILDLTDAIRQNILLAIPMKPLCKPDCAGICPVCGKDLNKESCNCSYDEIDPRWKKLNNLKNKNTK